MRVLYKSIAFLFLAVFLANAASNPLAESISKEKEKIANPSALNNKKTSVYLHPLFLIYGASEKTLMLYSTIEIPLSLYNAPIIKPSFWNGKNVTRIGSDFGFRHYLAGRGEGLYLQPQFGAFYFSEKNWNFTLNSRNYDDVKKSKGTWIDGMLYIGQSYKFVYVSISADVGIGYGRVSGEGALIGDANVGLGVSF